MTSNEFIKSVNDRRRENARRWKVRMGINWIPVFEETSEARCVDLQDSLQHKDAGEDIITVLESDLQSLGGRKHTDGEEARETEEEKRCEWLKDFRLRFIKSVVPVISYITLSCILWMFMWSPINWEKSHAFMQWHSMCFCMCFSQIYGLPGVHLKTSKALWEISELWM